MAGMLLPRALRRALHARPWATTPARPWGGLRMVSHAHSTATATAATTTTPEHSGGIGVGLLGMGDISQLHMRGILGCEGARVAGVWNRPNCAIVPAADVARRAEAVGARVFATAEELVADPAVDVVYVLTNMETHRHFAKLAIEAGKHVLVEKPMATSIGELEEMRDAAAKAGVTLIPGHNYVYEPQIMRMRRLLEEGGLGRPVAAYFMYNIHHPEEVAARYPGVIRQLITHHAYTLLYLLNDQPAELSALKATINDGSVPQENLTMINMRMASGALAHMQASFAADDHSSEPWSVYVKLVGTKGTARFSYNDAVINAPLEAGCHSHTYTAYPYSVLTLNEFVLQGLRAGRKPLSTVDDAITCMRVLDAAELSIAEGRHIRLDTAT